MTIDNPSQRSSLFSPDDPENDGDPLQGSYGAVPTSEDVENDWEELSTPDDESSASLGQKSMPVFTVVCILSTAFAYGCILTTLFLITLPVECERIHETDPSTPKSVALGIFVAIAGLTQLVSPLAGRLSDTYEAPKPQGDKELLGQRMPYHVTGCIFAVAGLLVQYFASYATLWVRYTAAFCFSCVGLNVQYAMMLALLADQVPRHQTGSANGILALELVLGSITGFALFHSVLYEHIQNMYGLYLCIVIVTSIATGTHAHDRDAELMAIHRGAARGRRPPAEPLTSEVPTRSPATATTSVASADERQWLLNTGRHPQNGRSPDARERRRRRRKRWRKNARQTIQQAQEIVLGPALILKSIVDPFYKMSWKSLAASYTIDIDKHYDFFIVTVSRLFYYCGMSYQTFFLYFLVDIIRVKENPESAVASLAILGQCSGAFFCVPVGVLSDRCFGGRRRPFVYAACAVLSSATLSILAATSLRHMVILCSILGGANGVYLTMDTSLAVDTLPKEPVEEEDSEGGSENMHGSGTKDNSDRSEENGIIDSGSAQLLGVWGVAAFLGSAFGPMIGGPLLYIVGHQEGPDEVEEYTLAGYAVVLSLSALYLACSAFTLTFINHTGE
jgi:MFS family permease